MSIHHRIAVVKRGWQIFRPSHVKTGACGGESQATGKSRRTPSPAAQRCHHRLAGPAEPGRLGGLYRQDSVEDVPPVSSRLAAEGEHTSVAASADGKEGGRECRKGF